MIKIPLKQPIRIGSQVWKEMVVWSDENQINIRYNQKTIFFLNKHSDHAIAFRLKFGL